MITELWESTDITNLSGVNVLTFTFTALSGGQIPVLVTHSTGTFTESVTKGLFLELNYIVKFISNATQGIDGETKFECSVKATLFFTPSHTPVIADRAGEWQKTNQLLAFLQAQSGQTFQVQVSDVIGGGLLQIDISGMRLFITETE